MPSCYSSKVVHLRTSVAQIVKLGVADVFTAYFCCVMKIVSVLGEERMLSRGILLLIVSVLDINSSSAQ